MPSPPKFLDVPETYRGLDNPVRFLAAYNSLPQAAESEFQVHMDSEFAQLFWNVAARWGYELGMMDTAQAIGSKHEEMSSELQILRDNAADVAAAQRNLHEATAAMAQQRQQIIDLEKDNYRVVESSQNVSKLYQRQLRRSPVYLAATWLETALHDLRHKRYGR